MAWAGLTALAGSAAAAGHAGPLTLLVEAPDSLAATAARIRRFDPALLLDVAWLAALDGSTAPIRVLLAPERSDLAAGTPRWIAGFAAGTRDLVVLFPSRTPSYPDASLEAVLRHELAHVLIARGAHGRALPRWFDEGLATTVERPWSLEDRTRLTWALLVDGPLPLATLDDRFRGGAREAARAYALAGAFVRDLLQSYGPAMPGRILAAVAAGRPFPAAFLLATGRPLESVEAAFWKRQRLWERWLPLLTSPFTLWTGVTLLALVAIWRHRRKRADRRRRWAEEEWEEADSGPW